MNPDENLDPSLTGENVETPADSPSEIITPGEGASVNPSGAENLSAEEATWNSLKGSTQDRIKFLAAKAKKADLLEEQLEDERRRGLAFNAGTQSLSQPQVTPDVQAGLQQLSNLGIATKDFTNQVVEDKVNQKLSGLVYNMELDRLEGKHNGSDGLPAFSRDEYEAYTAQYPQYRSYAPEDVYDKMYRQDILEAEVSKLNKPRPATTTPNLRPNRTRVQEEPLSPELIEQRLREPDGRQWYERNLEKINAVVSKVPASE